MKAKLTLAALAAVCLMQVDVKTMPAYEFGLAKDTTYNASENVFINTSMRRENWCVFSRKEESSTGFNCWDPVRIPAKKIPVFTLRTDLFREEDWRYATAGIIAPPVRRRFVGINVEAGQWPEESRVWPHLGLLYVGTTAEQEGFEVVLHDELIEGPTTLEKLIEPGDIVGLSLVTTGIERGVELAAKAKELGARYVIAGNDSAVFRAAQLLRLPGKPIDAVMTSNSVLSLRQFFRAVSTTPLEALRIPHVATKAADLFCPISNEAADVAVRKQQFKAADFFLIPNLSLFGDAYWQKVWAAYRSQFGHKHPKPSEVRNAIALFAQGCGRAGAGHICDYCTIDHVANIAIPEFKYIADTIATYRDFGINTFFNVTDSAFEMGPLQRHLKAAGPVDTLVMYGRAQPIAQNPRRLDEWLRVVNDRLLINCGMDSADETILAQSIHKSSSTAGSLVSENHQAIRHIRAAGSKAHLHYSLIFGSVGETRDSCERNLEFLQWSIDTLGSQLDVVEGDIFWVNFGAPCSVIFRNYEAAKLRAEMAGKTISREAWYQHFGQFVDALAVPEQSERAWYTYFTNISYDEAMAYNARVKSMMETVPGHVTGRNFAFKPPPGV